MFSRPITDHKNKQTQCNPGLLSFDNQLKIALDAISNHTVLKKVPNTSY